MKKMLILTITLGILFSLVIFQYKNNSSQTNNNYPSTEEKKYTKHDIGKDWDEITFLNHMIPHHQEAVDSAKSALLKTQNNGFITILNSIIEVQSQEIILMKDWYKEWSGKSFVDVGVYEQMMGGLENYEGIFFEREWLQSMIFHHQAVIYMSRQGRKIIQQSKLKNLMSSIITSQSAQILDMEKLIEKNRNRS